MLTNLHELIILENTKICFRVLLRILKHINIFNIPGQIN